MKATFEATPPLPADVPAVTHRSRQPGRIQARDLGSVIGLAVLAVVILIAVVPQVVSSVDPVASRPAIRFQPPGADHLFGTDYLGRDIYSRIVHGARLSLFPALSVVLVSSSLGSLVGLLAGYVGGWIDEAVMRFADIFLAVPALVLALAIATALGPGVVSAAIAVIVVWWPGYARLARAETQIIRTLEYVQAARNLGAGAPRIVLRHILPNIASSLVVKASLDAGTLLLILSGLSFLGVGAQPPTPEWGLEVATAGQYMFDSPWYLVAPSLAIFATVFSLNLVGDALRERLDPRLSDV